MVYGVAAEHSETLHGGLLGVPCQPTELSDAAHGSTCDASSSQTAELTDTVHGITSGDPSNWSAELSGTAHGLASGVSPSGAVDGLTVELLDSAHVLTSGTLPICAAERADAIVHLIRGQF